MDGKVASMQREGKLALVYNRGRQMLGKAEGGLITKLLRACDGDADAALAVLNEASGTDDGRAHVTEFIYNSAKI
jgi:hypothetical protein